MTITNIEIPKAKNFIAGNFQDTTSETLDIISPIDGNKIGTVPISNRKTVNQAVEAAQNAFPSWSSRTLKERVQVFFKFRSLLEQHIDELSDLITLENGKIFSEAKAEVLKGIELCEFACSLPQVVNDEIQEVSRGVECRTMHLPLGVVASITPFNFPHMVPMWTITNALTLGNCMIIKPSEVVPLSMVRIAELLKEAGLPDGVFNIVNGGKEVVEAICDHPDDAPILEGYGLSETSPLASFNRFDRPRKPGSVGLPVEGVKMAIVDENDKALPIGEKGEIVIKGHNVMKGYYKRPDANKKVFKNGWFHSGDVGVMDKDGYFYIVDRTKDMIIRGGFNVYPRELEEVMMEHPAVSLVAVIGVPHDSHGEEVKAFVVLKEGATASDSELIAWCKQKMAAYKYPRIIEIVDGMPMTATGKILKKELRVMATKGEKKMTSSPTKKTNGIKKLPIAFDDMTLLKDFQLNLNGQTYNSEYERVFNLQKKHALKLRTSSPDYRIKKLMKIFHYLQDKTPELQEAVYMDFRRHPLETIVAEVAGVLDEIGNYAENLERWVLPKEVPTPDTMPGAKGYIKYEPKGVVLIIAPWNYPFLLAIKPLIAAVAAGNTVIIKPSEMTPHTSAFIKKMVGELFKEKEVAVFEGDATVAAELLKLPFNHIFFTGSPRIGKIVMKSAAENLASVTLELGGKSPAIVDQSAKIEDIASSIVWGKYFNAGQTCVAPDYVLVHEKKATKLLAAMQQSLEAMYNADGKGVVHSPDLACMVNHGHFLRVKALLEDALSKGAKIVTGGETKEAENFISPTIITHITPDMQLMQEEIFGPILPVIVFQNKKEAVRYINNGEKPLALYIFCRNENRTRYYLDKTSSGGVAINDTIVQAAFKNLPFGGVNNSGIGKGYGHHGFIEFSNERGVVEQKGLGFRPVSPPYTKKVADALEIMLSS